MPAITETKLRGLPNGPTHRGLDRVIHERARLSVPTSLITHPAALAIGELKQLCGLTDGNLSRHLQVLEESKLVSKGLGKNRPKALCRITVLGRKRYIEYLAVLEQVIVDADRASDITRCSLR
jgi:hypothetical protein